MNNYLIEGPEGAGRSNQQDFLANLISGGIADIHDFHHRTLLKFKRLGKNQACNDRRKYHNLIFPSNIC
jgi:hypothetical protein